MKKPNKLEEIKEVIQDIICDDEVSDSALFQYCNDAIELIEPDTYTDDDKFVIIWDVLKS